MYRSLLTYEVESCDKPRIFGTIRTNMGCMSERYTSKTEGTKVMSLFYTRRSLLTCMWDSFDMHTGLFWQVCGPHLTGEAYPSKTGGAKGRSLLTFMWVSFDVYADFCWHMRRSLLMHVTLFWHIYRSFFKMWGVPIQNRHSQSQVSFCIHAGLFWHMCKSLLTRLFPSSDTFVGFFQHVRRAHTKPVKLKIGLFWQVSRFFSNVKRTYPKVRRQNVGLLWHKSTSLLTCVWSCLTRRWVSFDVFVGLFWRVRRSLFNLWYAPIQNRANQR